MTPTGSCLQCKFFLEFPKQKGMGECHRFPPRTDALLLAVDEKTGEPKFNFVVIPPRTHATNWCGEFAKALVIPGINGVGVLG